MVKQSLALADLGGTPGPPPPYGPKFSQFHAAFGKVWQNRMLTSKPPPPHPREGWRLLLWRILYPPMVSGLLSRQLSFRN